jgi:DNA polymerase III sliding clamp (beta) subunit (PCNA family)
VESVTAANSELSRQNLNGVLLVSAANGLIGLATNGFVLEQVTVEAPMFSVTRDPVIPTASIGILKKLALLAKPDQLLIRRSERLLAVGCAGFELVGGGPFPDCAPMIPADWNDAVICNRHDVTSALARLAPASNSVDPLLAAEFGNDTLTAFLAREPRSGRDIIAAETLGAGRFATRLEQLAMLLGELDGAEVEITGDKLIALRAIGDPSKVCVVSSVSVAPVVWEAVP